MKRTLNHILAAAAVAAAFACCTKPEEIVGTQDAAGFFLSRTSLTLGKGTTGTITATVSPKTEGASVNWSSDNEAVATVKDGEVTAVSGGDAVVTASYGGKQLACRVHVRSDVTTVSLDHKTWDFDKGDSFQLATIVGPEDVNVKMDTVWTSSDESVITVSRTGLVTAVGGGRATVTVAVNGVTDVCDFFSHCYPTGIRLEPGAVKAIVGKPVQFTATLLPADCTETLPFEWSVDDEAVATVDAEGVLTGVANGTTKLRVKAGEFTAEADVTVKLPHSVRIQPTARETVTEEDVTLSFFGDTRWGGGNYGIEIYQGGGFTVSVPEGFTITSITYAYSYSPKDFNVDKGNYSRSGSTGSWTSGGETVTEVTFTNPASEADVKYWVVNYE